MRRIRGSLSDPFTGVLYFLIRCRAKNLSHAKEACPCGRCLWFFFLDARPGPWGDSLRAIPHRSTALARALLKTSSSSNEEKSKTFAASEICFGFRTHGGENGVEQTHEANCATVY